MKNILALFTCLFCTQQDQVAPTAPSVVFSSTDLAPLIAQAIVQTKSSPHSPLEFLTNLKTYSLINKHCHATMCDLLYGNSKQSLEFNELLITKISNRFPLSPHPRFLATAYIITPHARKQFEGICLQLSFTQTLHSLAVEIESRSYIHGLQTLYGGANFPITFTKKQLRFSDKLPRFPRQTCAFLIELYKDAAGEK
ncbi:MAG: hypothetical protein BWY54_00844 [Candidatus Dependentiae bacterium ADurb.Bin331]|nr:MAG: hypothetical protein BWY54_00844 [Candidatus Dependentiae bacterium ADurb.Bin331]